jgi:hypothetical protein
MYGKFDEFVGITAAGATLNVDRHILLERKKIFIWCDIMLHNIMFKIRLHQNGCHSVYAISNTCLRRWFSGHPERDTDKLLI